MVLQRALLLSSLQKRYKIIHLLGAMIFFWAMFDASFSYLVPVVIVNAGYSRTLMGIILGSSSVFGAAFDYFLSKNIKNTHFRRIYLLMFSICFLCPFLLLKGHVIWILLSAMAFWGFYYDLSNFGNLDFISRKAPPQEHSLNFGLLWVFRSLGYTIGPIVIGLVADSAFVLRPFLFMWGLLAISLVFFIILYFQTRKKTSVEYIQQQTKSGLKVFSEIVIWKKVSAFIYPVLIMTSFYWIYDAFFWTIGPLVTLTLPILGKLNGFFVTLYILPFFIVGSLVGPVNKRFGKKRTALYAGIIGCAVLTLLLIVRNPYLVALVVFVSSIFVAFCTPSLNAAYSDYVQEVPYVEREIQALQDFFTNIGYIIGPPVAGLLADRVGNTSSFGLLGFVGCLVTAIMIIITPRHIIVKLK